MPLLNGESIRIPIDVPSIYFQTLDNFLETQKENGSYSIIYIIHCSQTQYYKIGHTNDLNETLNLLQQGSPFILDIIDTYYISPSIILQLLSEIPKSWIILTSSQLINLQTEFRIITKNHKPTDFKNIKSIFNKKEDIILELDDEYILTEMSIIGKEIKEILNTLLYSSKEITPDSLLNTHLTFQKPSSNNTTLISKEYTCKEDPSKEYTCKEDPSKEYTCKEDASTIISKEDASTTISKEDVSIISSKEDPSTTISKEDPSTTISKEDASRTISKEDLSTTISKEDASTTISKEDPSTTISKEDLSTTISKEDTSIINFNEDASTINPKENVSTIIFGKNVFGEKILENKKFIGNSKNCIGVNICNNRFGITFVEKNDRVDIYQETIKCYKIITYENDKKIKIWNAGEYINILSGHTDFITCSILISSQYLVTGSEDKTLRLWNLSSNQIELILYGHTDSITFIAKYDNKYIISASKDDTVRFWNLKTGLCQILILGFKNLIYMNCIKETMILNTDNKIIILNIQEEILNKINTRCAILNIYKLKFILNINEQRKIVKSSLYNSNVIMGFEDGTIEIWNYNNNIKILGKHFGPVTGIEFLSDTKILTSGDTRIIIWNLEKGESERIIEHKNTIYFMAIIDNIIISGSNNNNIQIWNEKYEYQKISYSDHINMCFI